MTEPSIHTMLEHDVQTINGIDLHIVFAGDPDAEPLILLHGFPEFWYAWRHQIDVLVNAGFRLIMPDQRGYNLSAKPTDIEAYNLDVLSDDVISLIDSTGHDSVTIIGHDWGGAIAWWTANKFPDRVKNLVTLNIPHNAVFSRALQQSLRQQLNSWYMAFFQLEGIPEMVTRLGNWWVMAQWAFRGAYSSEAIAKYKRAWYQPGAMTAMMNYYRAVRRFPPQKLDSPLIKGVPVLIIWGTNDRVFENELAEKSADLCDNARIIYIDGGTHWIQNDKPEAVNQALIAWLSKTTS